jgi:quinol monooxygenase YgiN
MATLIVTHRVSSFDTWKAAYDGHEPRRREAGFTSASVLRDNADPNLVTVVMQTPSLDRAKAFAGSAELKETMAKAGIQGPPEVRFLDDVEAKPY